MKHLVLGLFTIILLVGLIFFTGGFPQPKPLYAIGPHGEQAKVVDIDAYYEYQKNATAVRATRTTNADSLLTMDKHLSHAWKNFLIKNKP